MSSHHRALMNAKARAIRTVEGLGLEIFVPLIRLTTGEDPKTQLRELLRSVGVPILSIGIFLMLWSSLAASVETSIGSLPGPSEVWTEAKSLVAEHSAERQKQADFHVRMEQLKERKIAEGKPWKERRYSGKPTYLDQIWTSLQTVFAGFLIASLIAVPIGILCGLSRTMNAAFGPMIQVFKPVSPLAWLPIVMILVSALYTGSDRFFEKSFITSALTVSLCSLWPTLVNTSLGVASVDPDHMNVAKVLRLPWATRVFKIVVPSALPLIFAGLRLSLGVGWMVLIAAEMLAQNPGLGKFVWDMFQNGSSETLSQIMVAVFTIGLIGFALDRMMVALQRLVSFDGVASA
jgi:nitrate/nitrite transport system permease protein